MDHTTKIAGRDVAIGEGDLITVHFSAGCAGEDESGDWEFWTIFNEKMKTTARCLQGSDPGERFRRMEGLPKYKKDWEIAATAKGVRPAASDEVIAWLNRHQGDARFADACRHGLKSMNVEKTVNGFRFRSDLAGT